MEERRLADRFKLEQLVDISLGKEVFLPAEGINLSMKGLLCRSPVIPDPTTKVYMMLIFHLKEEEITIEIEGIILRVEKLPEGGSEFAIHFVDLSPRNLESLTHLMEHLEQEQ